jgi:hypothetical protein
MQILSLEGFLITTIYSSCVLMTLSMQIFSSVASCIAALRQEGWEIWATDLSQVGGHWHIHYHRYGLLLLLQGRVLPPFSAH